MTNSKMNLRRSIGSRRPGPDGSFDEMRGADPLTELTRFMDGDAGGGWEGASAAPAARLRPRPVQTTEPAPPPADDDRFEDEEQSELPELPLHQADDEGQLPIQDASDIDDSDSDDSEFEFDFDDRGRPPLEALRRAFRDAPEEVAADEEPVEPIEPEDAVDAVAEEPYGAPDLDEPYVASDLNEPYATPELDEPYAASEPVEPYGASELDEPDRAPEPEELDAPDAPSDPVEPEVADEPDVAEDPFMQALMLELDGGDGPAADAAPEAKPRPSFAIPAPTRTAEAAPARTEMPPRPARPMASPPAKPSFSRATPRLAEPSPGRAAAEPKPDFRSPPPKAGGLADQDRGSEPSSLTPTRLTAPPRLRGSEEPDPSNPTIAALNRLRDRLGRRDPEAVATPLPASEPLLPPDEAEEVSPPSFVKTDAWRPGGAPDRAEDDRFEPVPSEAAASEELVETGLDSVAALPEGLLPGEEDFARGVAEELIEPAADEISEIPPEHRDLSFDVPPEHQDLRFDAPSAVRFAAARQAEAGRTDEIADDGAEDDEATVFAVPTVRPRKAVPSFRFNLAGRNKAAEETEAAPQKPRDPDFDGLPGLGADDPWRALTMGAKRESRSGEGETAQAVPDIAGQLEDALFADDEPELSNPPRILAHRETVAERDWNAGDDQDEAGADAAEADADDGLAEAEYDEAYDDELDADAYYDEAEPEWEEDEHALPPHSLDEIDAAFGLAEPPRRRILPIAAGVVGLIALGVVGYFVYGATTGTETQSGPPPVIKADADGVKIVPDGATADASQTTKTVYDRVDGENGSGRVVRSTEEPIDPTQADAGREASSPLLPKRVRTVVVRPDGTIIPAEELDAAQTASTASQTDIVNAAQRAEQATGTATDGAAQSAADATDAAAAAGESAAASADAGDSASAPQAPSPIRTSERVPAQTQPVPQPQTAPRTDGTRTVSTTRVTSTQPSRAPLSLVPDTGSAQTAGTGSTTAALPPAARSTATASTSAAPAPVGRVGDRVSPAQAAAAAQRSTTQRTATTTAAATTAPTQTAAVSSQPSGPWAVQVSSQRSAEQARAAYQALQRRFPSILGGREPDIQVADLGTRGTFYRVRLPAGSKADASRLCSELKSAGGDCFVGKN